MWCWRRSQDASATGPSPRRAFVERTLHSSDCHRRCPPLPSLPASLRPPLASLRPPLASMRLPLPPLASVWQPLALLNRYRPRCGAPRAARA
jgi:hypothetical protein